MQLSTARGIISADMEQGGLLGQAICQVRAARKQERRAVLDTGVALAAEYERIRRAMPADAATWQARGEVCDKT